MMSLLNGAFAIGEWTSTNMPALTGFTTGGGVKTAFFAIFRQNSRFLP